MDLLRRILNQSPRLNQTELQLSEARRNQIYMMHSDSWQHMRRELRLA